jgi:hypothetical protein
MHGLLKDTVLARQRAQLKSSFWQTIPEERSYIVTSRIIWIEDS